MILYLFFMSSAMGIGGMTFMNSNSNNLKKLSLVWSCASLFFYYLVFIALKSSHGLTSYICCPSFFLSLGWFSFSFTLGMDMLGSFFLVLSSLLTIMCLVMSWCSVKFLKKEWNICIMSTNLCLTLIFLSMNLFMFYMFFELTLLPVFLLISSWGSSEQSFSASYYFFVYTLVGSLAMLLGLLKIYSEIGSLSVVTLYYVSCEHQAMVVVGFFLSLGVKVPMFPGHLWLPQAHVEAPLAGSVLLAGVLLKLGGYGIMSFLLPVFAGGMKDVSSVIVSLSMMAMVYGGVLTISQTDLKSLIAYSSVSHMGVVTLSLTSQSLEGYSASILIMLAHGLVSSGLFMSVTCLYESFHTSMMSAYKGLSLSMPQLALLFFLLTLASTGTPGSLNFLGEMLAFYAFTSNSGSILLVTLVLSTVILSAAYSVNLFTSLFFGESLSYTYLMSDMSSSESVVLWLLSVLAWFSGIWCSSMSHSLTEAMSWVVIF